MSVIQTVLMSQTSAKFMKIIVLENRLSAWKKITLKIIVSLIGRKNLENNQLMLISSIAGLKMRIKMEIKSFRTLPFPPGELLVLLKGNLNSVKLKKRKNNRKIKML